jgi:hypothetical protein
MPQPTNSTGPTRREFLKTVAAATAFASAGLAEFADAQQLPNAAAMAKLPWYRTALRWGQTNISEADIARYDIPWWRGYWKRTAVQGVIINAGGIYAFYPSAVPLHHRAAGLGERDLYGELAKAANDDGIAVVARMDSRGGHPELYNAHPDWFGVDANGNPFIANGFYLACINSPYYSDYIPQILREIVSRSHPVGFADNSWSGLGRNNMCYCANCVRKFRDKFGKDLPAARDWNDPVYRQWVDWNYSLRLEVWDNNNKVTREAGGPDCLWAGMLGAGIAGLSDNFRPAKEIAERSEIIMLDNQTRSDTGSLHENAVDGKLMHGILGWEKLIPESMAMYHNGRSLFRFHAKPVHESRAWMLSGFAGGIQPWWHHIGAYHEDRREYTIAEPVMQWHKANEQYLVNRTPVANVAVAWSQRNTDYFGRDNAADLVDMPMNGFVNALVRARIPFVPMHVDHLERDGANISVLVLPNFGAMSDSQIASVRKFVANGGSLIATGETSLFDDQGDPRVDFALADLFGVKGGHAPAAGGGRRGRGARGGGGGAGGAAATAQHTYLRLTPELRSRVDGPHPGNEPAIVGQRHAILAGFESTDILPYGGTLDALTVAAGAQVLMTFIPPFPSTPPEDIWMRTPSTDIPGLIINESNLGRVVYIPADIDRRFAIDNLPDHGDLLANTVRWAARDSMPVEIKGPGLLNCELYRQPGRLILHIVNLTNSAAWRAPIHELTPVGPLQISLTFPKDIQPTKGRTLVAGQDFSWDAGRGGVCTFELKSVLDHEVIVLEG